MIEILKSKLHRVTVTDSNINYEGSISISEDLMKASNLIEYQKVLVVDVNNGQRFETYVIKTSHSNHICLNGAAARLVSIGDKVIVMAFELKSEIEQYYQPIIVHVDEHNNVVNIDKVDA